MCLAPSSTEHEEPVGWSRENSLSPRTEFLRFLGLTVVCHLTADSGELTKMPFTEYAGISLHAPMS